jgi:hypothetical protein
MFSDSCVVHWRYGHFLPTKRQPGDPMTTANASLLLIAAYFLFLLISLKRRGQVISGPWLFLLRSFFPNWRFYHGPGNQPRLFWRIQDENQQWTDWHTFMPRAQFHVSDWFHNPRNNLTLANQNLVDHLSADIIAMPDDGDVRDLVTYHMVMQLTRHLINGESLSTQLTPTHYQFQLRLIPAYVPPDEDMAVLTSPTLSWLK